MSDFNFNWNSINQGGNPFDKKSTYNTDERFYTLPKNDKGEGVAIIRFLPCELTSDGAMRTFLRVFKYSITNPYTKRFLSIWSPTTIGLKDPIQEKWAQLWNSGQKEQSRKYARSERYICNIYIVKDPVKPENEGKVFLYDLSKTFAEKIYGIISPTPEEVSAGVKPKELFDPIGGYNFRLISQKGSNGFINYDKSSPEDQPSALFASKAEAVEFIKANTYKVSDFEKPEAYLSYDEIKAQLEMVENNNIGNDTPQTQAPQADISSHQPSFAQPTPEPQPQVTPQPIPQSQPQPTPQPSADGDLDSLIAGLMK